MAQGYIKLHRAIKNCWIWQQNEPFSTRDAWIVLLLSANHADKKILFEGQLKTIKAGQFHTSILKLSERWKWNRKKTTKFLNLLESDEMITADSTTHGTTITIVNWAKYQVEGTTNYTTDGATQGTTTVQPRHTNNNDKECIKNDKEIYCADFEQAWAVYPRHTEKKKAYGCYKARLKEGYSEAELLQATQKYADECKKQNREQKYIKLAATFWGVNTPFVDYLDKTPDNGLEYEEGALVYPIDYTNPTPPCYGLPAGWFDGDVLVKERMTPIKQPANKQMGLYNPVYYDVKAIIEMYNMRREWFEHNG